MRPIPLLITLGLLATGGLAGCTAPDDGTSVDDRLGPPRNDPLFSETWAGATTYAADVAIERKYDHLQHSYTHTGQALGTATYTSPDGKAMDEAPAGHVSGVMVIDRLLPAEVGTAQVTIPPAAQGAGIYTLHGIANLPPTTVLSATYTDLVEGTGPLETVLHFYVPPGLDRLGIVFTSSNEFNPAVSVTDPSGNERAAMAPDGSGSSRSSTDAQSGLWALHLGGPYQGTFGVRVDAT